MPGEETRLASCRDSRRISEYSHRKPAHSSPLLGRKQHQGFESAPDLQCPISAHKNRNGMQELNKCGQRYTAKIQTEKKTALVLTCMVTSLSSTITSLVRKSAPIVALYWFENFLLTY